MRTHSEVAKDMFVFLIHTVKWKNFHDNSIASVCVCVCVSPPTHPSKRRRSAIMYMDWEEADVNL